MTDPNAHWQQPSAYPNPGNVPLAGPRRGCVVGLVVVVGGLVVLGIVGLVLALLFAGRVSHHTFSVRPDPIVVSAPAPVRPLPAAQWRSVAFQATCENGHLQGTARVRNDGDDTRSVFVRYRLVRGTTTLGVLRGGAPRVTPGETARITLLSPGSCVSKPYQVAFSVDSSF